MVVKEAEDKAAQVITIIEDEAAQVITIVEVITVVILVVNKEDLLYLESPLKTN